MEGQNSKVNVAVNYHHQVLHIGNLGHFLHVTRVGHLHIIVHEQCYCYVYYTESLQKRYIKKKVSLHNKTGVCHRVTVCVSACVFARACECV